MPETVHSADGTLIAFDRQGSGPAIVLVAGALDDGTENAPLASELAASFTVYNYARRGRGASGDTPPYAVAREVEDLAALIAEAGGTANVHGVSSGGALALAAAAAGLPIDRLSVYEVPYLTDNEMLGRWRGYVRDLRKAIANGPPGLPLELFNRVAGIPDQQIEASRTTPQWAAAMTLEHTLAYDAAILGDGHPPTDSLTGIRQPTLAATGGGSGIFEASADAIAAAVPNAERVVLAGQGHVADSHVVADALRAFFGRPYSPRST